MNITPENKRLAEEKLQALKLRYLQELPAKLYRISDILEELQANDWPLQPLEELYRHIHGLAGSGATFGFDAISIQARLTEASLKTLLANNETPSADFINELESHIEELNAICKQAMSPDRKKAPDTDSASGHSELGSDVPPMRILVVDDDPLIRAFLNALLTAKKHQVVMAENGLRAVEVYQTKKPDLVIMDVMMPEMNGYEAAQQIKALPSHDFVPIIFLTALDSDQDLAKCIQCGGDDFLAKPINPFLLYARIFSMHRIRSLYNELARYKERTEEEIELSRRVFDAVTKRNRDDFPGLTTWLQSAGHFSGDMFNYECNENGQNYILLGDFTGHGLAAAIGAVPTADVFYAMAKKGASLKDIAEEINQKLHAILPTEKFMASILLKIDTTENTVEVMNSSMPSLLLLGNELQEASADNLPLGIIGKNSFSANCQKFSLSGIRTIILHTDGLNEAFNAAGEMYGLERLQQLVVSSEPAQVINNIKQDVVAFLDGQEADDDISLIGIHLE